MNIAFDSAQPFSAPSWALMGFEPIRAVWEYAGMRMMDKSRLPPGDGHPVVLFPGLASDKHAIGPRPRRASACVTPCAPPLTRVIFCSARCIDRSSLIRIGRAIR